MFNLRSRLNRFWEPVIWTSIVIFSCLTMKAALSTAHSHPGVFSAILLIFFVAAILVCLWYCIALFIRYSRYNKAWNERMEAKANRKECFHKNEDGWEIIFGKEPIVAKYNEIIDALDAKIEFFSASYDEYLMVGKNLSKEVLWFVKYPFQCFGRIVRMVMKKIGIKMSSVDSFPAPAAKQTETDARDNSSVGQVADTEENANTTPSSKQPLTPPLSEEDAENLNYFVEELKRRKAEEEVALPVNDDDDQGQKPNPVDENVEDNKVIESADETVEPMAILDDNDEIEYVIDVQNSDDEKDEKLVEKLINDVGEKEKNILILIAEENHMNFNDVIKKVLNLDFGELRKNKDDPELLDVRRKMLFSEIEIQISENHKKAAEIRKNTVAIKEQVLDAENALLPKQLSVMQNQIGLILKRHELGNEALLGNLRSDPLLVTYSAVEEEREKKEAAVQTISQKQVDDLVGVGASDDSTKN